MSRKMPKPDVKQLAKLYEPLSSSDDINDPPNTPARFLRRDATPSRLEHTTSIDTTNSRSTTSTTYSANDTHDKYDPLTLPLVTPALASKSTLLDSASNLASSEATIAPSHILSTTKYIPHDVAFGPGADKPLQRRRNSKPHDPVPATAVFARDAHPLHLPKLDEYISGLQPPTFSQPSYMDMKPFSPMEMLHKAKYTLDDLEHNSKALPWWDRQTILGAFVGSVIGFLVSVFFYPFVLSLTFPTQGSSAFATYYSLQGLTNTVQIFALILSTIGINVPLLLIS